MNALIIASTAIRTDDEGRYCLNDLHRAGGGEQRHQPRYWLANQQTQDLIAELGDSGNPLSVQKGGSEQGTYVAKELVYAYAMWISAAFHLKVIRAYDAMVAQPAMLIPQTLPEALRLAAEAIEERDRLALENRAKDEALAIAAPKAQALDRIAADEKSLTITQAAKVLSVKRETLTNWLSANGWMYRQNGSWVAYQQHIQNGRLIYKEAKYTDENTGQEAHRPYCHITPKGLTKLAEIFSNCTDLKSLLPEIHAPLQYPLPAVDPDLIDYFIPRPAAPTAQHETDKKTRRVGVVGLFPNQRVEIEKEFAESFKLSFWQNDDWNRLRAMAMHCDVVFVMARHVGHKTTNALKTWRANTVQIEGAVSSLRVAMTEYYLAKAAA